MQSAEQPILKRNHPGSSECALPGSGRWKQPAGHPCTCSNGCTNYDTITVTYKKPSKKPSSAKEPEDPDSPKKYLDGKYTASAKGFNGDVKVIVTIKDGVIEALEQENTDTEQFFERAWSVLEKQIIGTDSVMILMQSAEQPILPTGF